ncbi:MAG: discoidin domain-containing protein, partial [Planctomycetes bacterium]|nr:discoidin domain-containing protein [Planctomycetota bacterium]
MKRCTFMTGSWLVIAVFVLSPRLSPARTINFGDSMRELIEADWIDQDSRFAPAKSAKQSPARKPTAKVNAHGVTTAQDAAGACDGIKNGRWGFHTASSEQDPWWQVDLQNEYALDRIVIFNRTDGNTAPRTRNICVLVAGADGKFKQVYKHDGQTFYGVKENKPLIVSLKDKNITARIVRLQVPGKCSFTLDEVEVYSADEPQKNIALNKPADQKSVGRHSYPGTLPAGVDSAVPPKVMTGSFELAHTQAIVQRGKSLLERLRRDGDSRELQSAGADLKKLRMRLAALEIAGNIPHDTRKGIYLDARRLVRRIAFANPLLDFDKLLFIKRHDSVGVFHMCDQYYGCNARPGGGLFVLSDPFGGNPKLTNVLEDSTVERGRLAGDNLSEGAFLSPEVSYDGKTILFAYTQAKAWEKYRGKEAYEWGPEISYHIFKVNADGSGLVQLTGGPNDDFDPCFLPNGRIVFITERRGGYLRCGRHCPVYTMYSMEPDGSDIICISFHETHEWQPSVDNDGMLVYTRWDYVDRDTNIAHHIWRSF